MAKTSILPTLDLSGAEAAPFLAEIRANRDDDAPRLVFADWLDERGDPLGAFIRIQCRLEQNLSDEEDYWALRAQSFVMETAYRSRWRKQVPELGRIGWGLAGNNFEGDFLGDRFKFRRMMWRGFVQGASIGEEIPPSKLDELGVDEWFIATLGPADVESLADSPRLANLRALHLGIFDTPEAPGPLWASQHWRRLRALTMPTPCTASSIAAIAAGDGLRQLRQLDGGIQHPEMQPAGWGARMVEQLLAAPWLPQLTTLRLPLEAGGVARLGDYPRVNALRTLSLSAPNVDAESILQLLAQPAFAGLGLLWIQCRGRDEKRVWKSLLESGHLPALRAWKCQDAADLPQVIEKRLEHLRMLTMPEILKQEALAQLGESPAARNLNVLDMKLTNFSRGLTQVLEEAPALENVHYLSVLGSSCSDILECSKRLRARFGLAVTVL